MLVVLVAVFSYLLVQIINYQRAQEYRESLTDGMAYIISEGLRDSLICSKRWIGFQMRLICWNCRSTMSKPVKWILPERKVDVWLTVRQSCVGMPKPGSLYCHRAT